MDWRSEQPEVVLQVVPERPRWFQPLEPPGALSGQVVPGGSRLEPVRPQTPMLEPFSGGSRWFQHWNQFPSPPVPGQGGSNWFQDLCPGTRNHLWPGHLSEDVDEGTSRSKPIRPGAKALRRAREADLFR